jgi:type II secretory pathway pseudopilin PulG
MKFPVQSHKFFTPALDRGFALVATLLMMIMLVIIAVGTLSLSTVTLRTNNHQSAQALAQANARMALMIAIGELQKYAGPDRAITATSEILATPPAYASKPNTTGVWESWWDFDPSIAPDYNAEKAKRFRRWLVSSADETAPLSMEFTNSPWTGETVQLVGDGTLGNTADDNHKVFAGLVAISREGKVQGSYAWHVADESIKARINLYRDPSKNTTLAQKRALLGGHRPNPTVLTSSDGSALTCLPNDHTLAEFNNAMISTGKVLDLDQAELLDLAKGKIKPLRHDITTHSLGVMCDVRGGGLKQDLSSMFEMGSATANTLPTEFTNKKLFQSTHGITGASDPNWSALAGYYNSFRNLTTPDVNPTQAVKLDAVATAPVPTGYNLTPVIAKVDTIFSLIGRPIRDVNWMYGGGRPGSTGYNYDYFVNLIFTPMVTLHNPYNVNLSFYSMNVDFTNIPIAFNFMLQPAGVGPFISQSMVPGAFESLNNMTYRGSRGNKKFIMKIADWKNAKPATVVAPDTYAINGPIVMKPGQTLVFSPYFSAQSTTSANAASFYEDSKNVTGTRTIAFDWQSHMTSSIKAKPIFVPGVGFETCLIVPSHIPTALWNLHLLLRDPASPYVTGPNHVTDRFYVEFKVQQPSWYPNNLPNTTRTLAAPSFEVNAELQVDATSLPIKYTSLKFDYANEPSANNIKDLYNNRVYRYPPTPNSSLRGIDVGAPNRQPYATQASYVHPLAIFSAYARTTSGGVYETGKREPSPNPGNSSQINVLKDGRLAGKPFLFHNVSRSNFVMNLATEKPSALAYELNFQPFLSKGDYQDYMDVDVNRVPSLTGNMTTSGIKSGSYLEIPSGPLQTIADFRRSGALATSYQPHFVQPVSNSSLHPLMSSDKVVETDPSITSNTMLDHSVLANHALYDRFYFSTFATQGTTKPDIVFEQFINGTTPLSLQAFQPYLSAGKTAATAKAELYTAGVPNDGAYKTAAEYQMIRGPFNVNSTSVQAWKAILASMKKSDVAILWARNTTMETKASSGIVIPGMSMLNAGSLSEGALDAAKIDNARTNTWNGYRDLTEDELEILAEKIVEEVRARGPFLSMSEFVNRQVGSTDEKTIRGALESAIAKAEINEKQNALFPDTFLSQIPITPDNFSDTNLYNYKTPEAAAGNPAAGSPGWVNQGDLLRILEPSATVRGDTFVIRTYGEAKDNKGKVTARAYIEAVVQRFPEYVDSSDRPSLNAATDPTAKAMNKAFGRRFEVVSFRWLTPNEI